MICAIHPKHLTFPFAASPLLREIAAMGRLVRIPRERTLDAARAAPRDAAAPAGDAAPSNWIEQDDYLLRLAKYVPAEVLAFSILINAILDQALRNGGTAAAMAGIPVMTIAVAALVLGTLMSPFFVWYVHEKGDAWVTNACVSLVAFPFWSYALGAVAFTDIRDGNLAAILLASFSVMSGLIKPQSFEAARAQEAVEAEPEIAQEGGPRVVRSAATAARRLVEVTNTIPLPGP
jgi:hypothetical protein